MKNPLGIACIMALIGSNPCRADEIRSGPISQEERQLWSLQENGDPAPVHGQVVEAILLA